MAKQPSPNVKPKTPRPSSWNDLKNWFAHGATELANFLVHGHPAPMYAGNSSPAETQTNVVVTAPQANSPPDAASSANPARPSLIDQHLNAMGAPTQPQASMEAPAMSNQSLNAANPSLIDQHLEAIQQSPELQQPEQEIER